MVTLKKDNECMACGRCYLACPNRAIHFEIGEYQNYFPVIDNALCTQCHVCEEQCRQVEQEANSQKSWKTAKYYIGYYNNGEVRKKSSSGGLFSAFALWVLKQNGIVIGASFDSDTQTIRHIAVSDVCSLQKLRKSKYAQSDWVYSCDRIEDAINYGKIILFSGTPCQAATVRKFYGSYKNLYIVDLFCHGVSGAGSLKNYLQSLEAPVTSIDFRYKNPQTPDNFNFNVQCEGKDRVERWGDNLLCRLFINSASLKKACFKCPYAQWKHVSDITIGDFDSKGYARANGIDYEYPSIAAINTTHGTELFEQVKDELTCVELEDQELIKNYYRPREDLTGSWGYNEIIWEEFQRKCRETDFVNAAFYSAYAEELQLIAKAEKVRKDKDDIAIYGAGECGKSLLRILRMVKYDWNISFFVVTKEGTAGRICDIPVISVRDLAKELEENKKDLIVMVAVSESHRNEIMDELKSWNIHRVVSL